MDTYDQECISVFLKEQGQLFDEDIVFDEDDAREFLEEVCACVCSDINDVRDCLEEMGMDVYGISDEELEDQAEVFALPSGRYLVVEG